MCRQGYGSSRVQLVNPGGGVLRTCDGAEWGVGGGAAAGFDNDAGADDGAGAGCEETIDGGSSAAAGALLMGKRWKKWGTHGVP